MGSEPSTLIEFYSHVNYSVTKIVSHTYSYRQKFYSHVNYSVTKIYHTASITSSLFYSHVNYSVTKIGMCTGSIPMGFTVT